LCRSGHWRKEPRGDIIGRYSGKDKMVEKRHNNNKDKEK
jgi:hypothetical protein